MSNLSATFLSTHFGDRQLKVLPYVDYLFGNAEEALVFAKSQGWNLDNVEEIAKKIAAMEKANTKRDRTVIITQGKDPVIVAQKDKVNENLRLLIKEGFTL